MIHQVILSENTVNMTIKDLDYLAREVWVLSWGLVGMQPDGTQIAVGSSLGLSIKVSRTTEGYSVAILCHGQCIGLSGAPDLTAVIRFIDHKLNEMI